MTERLHRRTESEPASTDWQAVLDAAMPDELQIHADYIERLRHEVAIYESEHPIFWTTDEYGSEPTITQVRQQILDYYINHPVAAAEEDESVLNVLPYQAKLIHLVGTEAGAVAKQANVRERLLIDLITMCSDPDHPIYAQLPARKRDIAVQLFISDAAEHPSPDDQLTKERYARVANMVGLEPRSMPNQLQAIREELITVAKHRAEVLNEAEDPDTVVDLQPDEQINRLLDDVFPGGFPADVAPERIAALRAGLADQRCDFTACASLNGHYKEILNQAYFRFQPDWHLFTIAQAGYLKVQPYEYTVVKTDYDKFITRLHQEFLKYLRP